MKEIQALRTIVQDEERKPLPKIIKEAAHCAVLEKEIPIYYFTCLLYKKHAPDYRLFIGHKKLKNIRKNVYYKDGENKDLSDKLLFEGLLLKNNIKTPKIFAYNEGLVLHIGEDAHPFETVGELQELLRTLIDKSPNQSIFVKRRFGYGGFHAMRFDKDSIHELTDVATLFQLLHHTEFIFQETVVQHSEIARIFPHSVNTLRVHAYTDKATNHFEVLSASLRFGVGKSVVDNSSSGGSPVPIDVEKWVLKKRGYSFLQHGAKQFTEHPDTHVVFEGFAIPFGDAIEPLLKEAATLFDNIYIGWDIAITEEGPIIIEANQNPHVHGAQITSGGFRGHPGFRRMLDGYL